VLRKNDTKGKLIVVEGIDGSGKSTQIDLLYNRAREKVEIFHPHHFQYSALH